MRPIPILIRFIPVHNWSAFDLNVDEPTLYPRQASLNKGHSTIWNTYGEERDYQGVWDRHNPVENAQHESHPSRSPFFRAFIRPLANRHHAVIMTAVFRIRTAGKRGFLA